jgi:hypothetical protein
MKSSRDRVRILAAKHNMALSDIAVTLEYVYQHLRRIEELKAEIDIKMSLAKSLGFQMILEASGDTTKEIKRKMKWKLQ